MALAATMILEVQTGGADTNGGGFNPGNANFPTDLACDANTGNTASPVVSSASYTFVAGDVGAWVFVKSGTNWIPGWYPIASVAGGKATLNAAVGAGVRYLNGTAGGPTTAVGCGTVATPTAGTFGVDYSQGGSARLAFTDLVIGGTTTQFTSAGNPVGKNFVGNHVRVTSGTGFTVGTYEIVSTTGTTATCDRSLGTAASTGGVGNLGGALASPGMAYSLKVAGTDIFVKAGTYTLTSTTANVSGGRLNDTTGGASMANPSILEGYNAVRGDKGTAPVLSAGALTAFTIIAPGGVTYLMHDNLVLNCNSGATVIGFDGGSATRSFLKRLQFQNAASGGKGFQGGAGEGILWRCTATGCAGAAFDITGSWTLADCEAWANTATPFQVNTTGGAGLIRCIASGNTGASTDGFGGTGTRGLHFKSCVAYGNGRHGFNLVSTQQIVQDCIAEANGGFGFTSTAGVNAMIELWNCADFNNTSGRKHTANVFVDVNPVTGSGSFFTNAASGDFSLNATAGAGAAARAAGLGTLPRGTSGVGYPDIGAVQHQDAGGASLAIPPLTGVLAA
jgi:hypothetical protein